MQLKFSGILSAKHVGIIAFWAKEAGLSGRAAKLAANPESKNFSRTFDRATGMIFHMNADLYEFQVPGSEPASLSCSPVNMCSTFVYKELAAEIVTIPDFPNSVNMAAHSEGWGLAWKNHPWVLSQSPTATLVPLGLYLDGVAFTKRDSALGIWLINLLTEKRYLTSVIRKKQLCSCGCKGWCSLHDLFRALSWLMEWMRRGEYPRTRHDNSSWPTGGVEESLAGKSLGYKAQVILIKADWQEFAAGLGMPTWAHHEHPCFACVCSGGSIGSIREYEGNSVLELAHEAKTASAYIEHCIAAEKIVLLRNRSQLERLLGHLDFFNEPQAGGRCLISDFAELGLLARDRLEPSDDCPDPSNVQNCNDFPLRLTFWRVHDQGMTKHRNPLFHERTGLTVENICIDEMHTLHLGVFSNFVSAALWEAIRSDCLVMGRSSMRKETADLKACAALRQDLFRWYKAEFRRDKKKPLYKLDDLPISLLGDIGLQAMKAKAGETGTLLDFATDFVSRHVDRLPHGKALLTAGKALQQYMSITRNSPGQLKPSQRQLLMDAALSFLAVRASAGIHWKPKMHLMLHLVFQTGRYGNPMGVATWVDEGLNRCLRDTARTAHSRVWIRRVLATFRSELGPTARLQRTNKKARKIKQPAPHRF